MALCLSPFTSRSTSVWCHASGKRQGSVKVNDRGKVSSRPGPASPREQKKRVQEAAKVASQQEDVAAQQPEAVASNSQSSSATSSGGPSIRPPTGPMETPQVVVDRIFPRMVACAGLPLFAGIASLVVIAYFKRQNMDDFPMWPAYMAQGATLFGGLAGITYGALSASWDPAQKGSLLGWTEFRANLSILLSRGKQQ